MKKNFLYLFLAVLSGTMVFQGCTPKAGSTVAKPEAPKEEKLVGIGESQPSKPAWATLPIPKDESIRSGTLPNGMKYYIQKNTKPENRAELRLAVNAGAMQEDDDQQGLAHFVEHMAFNGSKNFKKSELVDYLESIGTKFGPDLNAYTSFDETVYMLQARTDDEEMLSKGLLILQDWAGGIAFEDEEIDKERGVVASEYRSRLGAGQRMSNQYFPVLFKDSRYANRLPIGKPEIIKNAPYDAFKRFYRDWYRPELMSVIVVGDVDLDKMEMEIKKRFTEVKNDSEKREKVPNVVPKHKETLVSIVTDKEASIAQVQLMYKHDPGKTETLGDFRQNIMHSLYNGMLNNRLRELTQKADPPFLGAFSGYSGFVRGSNAYFSSATVSEDGAIKGLEAILTENTRVLKHGFNASELEREKVKLLERVEKSYKERDKTQSGRLARRLVSHYLEGAPIPSPEQSLEMHKKFVPTITIQEVNKLAKKWITDENRVVIITGPEKEGLEIANEAKVREVLEAVKTKDIKPYVDKVVDKPLLATKLAPTPIKDTKVNETLDVTEITLANGVRLILKPTNFKNDEILFTAFSDGGSSLFSDADQAIAGQFINQVIGQSGVGEFSNTDLQKMMAGKTVRVSPFIGELSEGMRGNASPKDLETMFQMIYLYFTQPRKDETAFQSMMTRSKIQLANIDAIPQFVFFKRVSDVTYGGHPRRQIVPSMEDLNNADLDKIVSLYKERFADASDFTFLFVGNFEVESFSKMAATYLGNLPSTNRGDKWKDLGIRSKKGTIVEEFEKGAAPRSQVQLNFRGDFDWDNAQDRYDFYAMQKLLSIKMRESMREDKGGVYGVGVRGNISRNPVEAYNVTVSFNCDPGKEEELINTALADIENLKKNGVEAKDITKIQETQKQERIKGLKENNFWLNYLSGSYQDDLDPERILIERYNKKVDSLNSDSLQKMANRVFDMKNYAKFVMKPEPKKE